MLERMAKHFEAAPTIPLEVSPSARGGRIEILGGRGALFVGMGRARMGRSPQCELVVDDASVSAFHAAVCTTPAGVHLLDTGSKNGIFVAGNRVVEMYLSSPTDFACGDRLLRFVPMGQAVEAMVEEAREPMRFGPLAGRGSAMRRVLELLEKHAQSDVSIVITGETGTGKDVVARAVHAASRRRHKPFVTINCGAVPENLIEDQLFGHVKGAFTGAAASHDGLFVQADGGTLFFDEVAEMSAPMQAKLLRVLEFGLVRPLGSTQERRVDVRVLSATNASLEAEVNRGRFREDLLFRLCQVRVQLPPLRERPEDLPLLVQQILVDLGHPEMGVEDKHLRALQARSWRGNVRELRNVLAVWASAGAPGSMEEAFQSGPQMQRPQGAHESVVPTRTWADEKAYQKGRYFMALWGSCRGNITQIAKVAGVQRKVAREALRAMGMGAQDEDANGGELGK